MAQRVEVAADMSYYRDYSKQDGYLVKEPTLSQRIVFDIRPSSEMAALLSNKDNSNGSVTGNYLEEYQMIAPAGKVLRVGPMYRYLGTDGNYYKSSSERITTGQWYRNGVAINPSIQNNRVAQITVAQGGAADEEVVYTLVAGGKGIAKFTVKFQSTDKVGPRATELVSAATLDSDYKYITGQRFDGTDKNVPLQIGRAHV